MSGINQTQKIMTEREFNKSPLKSLMSYQDYFSKALKAGSTFTFAKAIGLQNAQNTSNKIENEVEGWYIGKEKQKNEAEAEYCEA